MIQNPAFDPKAPFIVIGIGNTNIRVATCREDDLSSVLAVATGDADGFAKALDAHLASSTNPGACVLVIGSVVPDALERVNAHIFRTLDRHALVVGDSVPLPLDVVVEDPRKVGVDRVCGAAAAYDRIQAACVVIDFGTAVTVDLVDDEGVFLGGAILPGVQTQLSALAQQAAALPSVTAAVPDQPIGRNTEQAIQTGVCRGVIGAARALVEAYATELTRWPQVVATGGDLPVLLPHCDFIDTPVTDLTLRGIALAYQKHLIEIGV